LDDLLLKNPKVGKTEEEGAVEDELGGGEHGPGDEFGGVGEDLFGHL